MSAANPAARAPRPLAREPAALRADRRSLIQVQRIGGPAGPRDFALDPGPPFSEGAANSALYARWPLAHERPATRAQHAGRAEAAADARAVALGRPAADRG